MTLGVWVLLIWPGDCQQWCINRTFLPFFYIGFPAMSSSSRRPGVDKIDRTITRLYTYLSGSEEGEENGPEPPSSMMNTNSAQQRRRAGQHRNGQHHHHYQEPEYQQPYAYPPAHAQPFNPAHQHHSGSNTLTAGAAGTSLGGSTPTSSSHNGGNNSDDHASSEFSTFTESELALTHQATLPMGKSRSLFVLFFVLFLSRARVKHANDIKRDGEM